MLDTDNLDPDYLDPDYLYHWRLCDELSIMQASLLYAGIDPSSKFSDLEYWKIHERPNGYEAAKNGILKALLRGAIKGSVCPEYDADMNGNRYPIDGTASIESIIDVDSLKAWLKTRGVHTGFFFPEESSQPDYLNKDHPRYSAQLAATIKVWIAFEDDNLLRGNPPKRAMEDWLTSRYFELGLIHQDKISNTAIEECAKVANWHKNGATKTPTS